MYWFREFSWTGISLAGLVIILFSWGGWLIVRSITENVRPDKQFLAGFGAGLIIYSWLVNIFGYWFSDGALFLIPAVFVFGAGVFLAKGRDLLPTVEMLRTLAPLILVGLAVFWMFVRISKGLGIFDEYKNLALISIMANGEFPLVEYAGTDIALRYHYGFHIFPAALMRLGGLMPWSAFDISKAVLWGYLVILAWALGEELFKNRIGAAATALVVLFSGGTRYLLLLLPADLLIQANPMIDLLGATAHSAGSFFESLTAAYQIDAGPPIPYPIAYLSGINPPIVVDHAGQRTLTMIFLLLFIFLIRYRPAQTRPWHALFWVVFFSFLALTAEAAYLQLLIAITIFIGLQLVRLRSWKKIPPVWIMLMIAVLVSLPVSILQGGTISALVERNIGASPMDEPLTGDPTAESPGFMGFSLRSPPAVMSSHLGEIPLDSFLGWIIAVFETGIIILALPVVTVWVWKRPRLDDHTPQILLILVWFGLLLPLFLRWEHDRDITRITSFSLNALAVLALFYLAELNHPGPERPRRGAWFLTGTLFLSVFGGFVLHGIQMTAARETILAHRYGLHDARILQQVWGTLPEDSKVFGPVGKMSILSGHLTGGIYHPALGAEQALWEEIWHAPSVEKLVEAGYDFAYLDHFWISGLPEGVQDFSSRECVQVLAEGENKTGQQYTRILDLRGCYPSP